MLVLTRTPGERIVLPGLNITIQVSEILGGRVRIAIDAPPEVRIVREELLAPDHVLETPAESPRGAPCFA